jgi:hypothetical protein
MVGFEFARFLNAFWSTYLILAFVLSFASLPSLKFQIECFVLMRIQCHVGT